MSYKKELLKNTDLSYIPNWDFSAYLDIAEQAMLCYLIDNDDFRGGKNTWHEITPGYVQRKRPAWKTSTIRTALTALVEKGYVLKRDIITGRGNHYKLNIEKIEKDMILPFLSKYSDCRELEADYGNIEAD